jgi:RecA/RadA recombinase
MGASAGHTIDLNGIVVIVGNYGSGKTEVAINLAIYQKKGGMDVRVGDLDLVNPYFRTREARQILADRGIDLVLPPIQYLHADLPILAPEIAGMIRQPGELAILDAGGDDVGATVLAALADHLRGRAIQTLQVVNPFRPFTDTIDGCLKIRREIEAASKLTATGLVGNANLIDDTSPSEIEEGYDFVKKLSEESGLPLAFITAATDLLPRLDTDRFTCPVLPVHRQLVPPWRRSAADI